MRTLYKYTNSNMGGWEFVIVQDNGEDGYLITGNTASTAISTSHDLCVVVETKKQLKEIVARLDWLGKYTNQGRK